MTGRLPLEPLRSHIARTLGQRAEDTTAAQCALRCGVADRTWTRWAAAGGIDVWTADRVACKLGEHPCAIWDCGEWDTLADAEAERVEAERAARRARRNSRRPSRAEVMA